MTGALVVIGIVLVALLVPLGILMLFTIRKIPPGKAGVRVGWSLTGGKYVISDTIIYRIPIITRYDLMDISVQKLSLERKGQEGLICRDNIRADIEVAFYIKVNYPKVDYPIGMDHASAEGQALYDEAMKRKDRYDDIQRVAQTVGCERATDIEKLNELFEAKFSEALKTAGKLMDFTTLYTERIQFRDEIINVIGKDLNGYALEDIAIDYLEQTPLETLDPNNVLDAEGIKKITVVTAKEQEETNLRTQSKRVEINDQNKKAEIEVKDQDVRAEMEKRKLDQANEQDLADRTRDVDVAKARASRETAQEVESNRRDSEIAAIEANEKIQDRDIARERVVISADKKKDMELLELEQQKLESGETAEVDRNRRVGVKEKEMEAEIIKHALGVADQNAILQTREKEVTLQRELRLDVAADKTADRAARVLNVKFQAQAEADQKKVKIASEADKEVRKNLAEAAQIEVQLAAEAQKQAAMEEGERIKTLAEANSKASEKENHAMQERAKGVEATEAASGLARAKVKTADAAAEEALGLAEANVIREQGSATGSAEANVGKGKGEGIEAELLAEALGKTEMAKAVGAMNAAGKDHEEFQQQLKKDLEVELAEIKITKDVAEAQARVVGEALKSANIDIVGGENDFFEKVVKSVIQGRSVDRLMNNSQTLTDVKNTFFTGDPDHFKAQLRGWIKDLGFSSEDVKNLTVAALLTKLMSKADDSGTRSLIRQAQKAAKESGITDIVVSALLGDKAGK